MGPHLEGRGVSASALPDNGRFSAYLPAERALLHELAAEEGCSENYLVRIGVRALLGLPVPTWARERIEAGGGRRTAAA
jgi:hypothetical protein